MRGTYFLGSKQQFPVENHFHEIILGMFLAILANLCMAILVD